MPPQSRHRALWDRILAHRFDDPGARLTFTARLARENGWTIGRAVRVVDEYRRFVFLALTAGHAVTPSEDVDQAWHLHLAYTRNYWDIFCGDVLGQPLHHGPTRGGTAEADRYKRQYQRTLAAYEAAFDAPPPADIWPPPEQRFGADLAWRRVNMASHWVVPKPRWCRGRTRRPPGLAGLAAVPLVAAGIPNPLDLNGPSFFRLFAALAAGSIVAGFLLRRVFRPAGDATASVTDLEPAELALLADDGPLRFAALGLATLPASVAAEAGGALRTVPPPTLAAVHARLAAVGAGPPLEAVSVAVDAAREEFEPRLVERGLLVGRWWLSATPWIILAPAIATLALGIAKIGVGIARGRDVGSLMLGCFALAAVSLLLLGRKLRRTRQGDAVFDEARRRFEESGRKAEWLAGSDAALPMAVAMLGTATLGNTAFAFVADAVRQLRATAAGSSSGHTWTDSGWSDSGGGGFGGCGGGGGGD